MTSVSKQLNLAGHVDTNTSNYDATQKGYNRAPGTVQEASKGFWAT